MTAVRVWKRMDEPPVEICGEKLNKEEHEMFLSDSNSMMITYYDLLFLLIIMQSNFKNV